MKSAFRVLIGLAVLGLTFWAGTAWKNSGETDTTRQTPTESRESESPAARAAAMRQELTEAERATIRLFEEAKPSVCFITVLRRQRDFFTMNVTEVPQGSGSGFIWDKKGHIVTNFHVIRGSSSARVTLADGSTFKARTVGYASEKDLAVLRIDAPASQLQPIRIGSSYDLRVGQSVYAIGNPFGLDHTLTTGIVSALGREIQSLAGIAIRDVIQTDAAINPGNSGGPLLDSSGRLIGVNTAIYSPSGASAGIGFSIPVDAVRWVIPDLIAYGKIKRPTVGIEPAPGSWMKELRLEGVLVLSVTPNGAAEQAGIRPTTQDRYGDILLGDIIVGFEGEPIRSLDDLFLTLEKYEPGDEVILRVLREDRELDLTVRLQAPKN